ncbi:MAG: radical SAM/SPASM domain-containing protein [Promethearchaeota archaeon]|jgi:MoaA/NifB/PqqE/SkfB family radical SAM enzyme
MKFFFLYKPYILVVETGTICNIDCPTCPTPRKIINRERSAKNMDFNNFKKIIDNSHKSFVAVLLYWSNEPLLNRDLVKMVRYCNELNLYTFISTNMTLLTGKKFKELIQAGLDELLVCVDGFSTETFEHFRKGAKFEKVKKNIETICKIKKELKADTPWIEIQYIETKQNSEEIASCKKWAAEIAINGFRVQEIYIARHLNDYKKLRDEFYTEKMWEKRHYKKLQTGMKTCKTPDTQVCVLVDGQVTICCNDIKGICTYGNLLKDSFESIAKNKKYLEIKKKGMKRDLSICKLC